MAPHAVVMPPCPVVIHPFAVVMPPYRVGIPPYGVVMAPCRMEIAPLAVVMPPIGVEMTPLGKVMPHLGENSPSPAPVPVHPAGRAYPCRRLPRVPSPVTARQSHPPDRFGWAAPRRLLRGLGGHAPVLPNPTPPAKLFCSEI